MFGALGTFAYKRRWFILAAGLLFAGISAFFSYNLSQSLTVGGFIDPEGESTRAGEQAQRLLGREQGQLVVLFNSRNGANVDNPEYRQRVETILSRLQGQPGVGNVFTFYNTGLPYLVSRDRTFTYAVVGLPGNEDAQVHSVERLKKVLTGDEFLQVRLGGRPAVNEEIIKQAEADLLRAELITFPIVGLLLVFIFRSLIAAVLPLLIGGISIIGAYLLLRIATSFSEVSIYSLNIVSMLGLGLSIDYSLFVVSRFREELALTGGNVPKTLVRTMKTAGHTVFFSGLTVIVSLLSLMVFDPIFLKSMGFGGAMAVLVAMVAAMTILPAMLALLGRRVNSLSINALFGRKKKNNHYIEGESNGGYWYRISQFVMRRPVLVLVVTLTPLLIIGSPFLRINFSTFDARTLPENHGSRQVSDILVSQFPPNETAPVEVLVQSRGPILEAVNIGELYDYVNKIKALPGVLRIDSLVSAVPGLDKAGYQALYSRDSLAQNPQAAQLAARFSRENVTLISVIYADNPYASTTQDLVRSIRNITTFPFFVVLVGGDTALLVDLLSSLGQSLPLAFGLIVGVLFVLLYLMLGSLVVPLKAVILNILSLSACFGALVWVFQDGNFASLLGFTSTGTIDSTQPVLIFAGAFGLSLDYEVFLLSRIKEHYDRTNDLRAAVALGVQKTGGIITGAALLLVVVIGSFISGEVLFIKQIGLGLAIAILVDATVVRTLLLPATMRLMGRYNWWAPAPLVKLHQKLGFAETELEPEPVSVTPEPVMASVAARPVIQQPIKVPAQYQFPTAPGSGYPLPAMPANGQKVAAGKANEDLFRELRREIFENTGPHVNPETRLLQLLQLAELSLSMDKETEAIQYFEESLKMMERPGYEQNRVLVLNHLSNLYTERPLVPEGMRVSLEGLRLCRQTGQGAAEFTFLNNLAELSLRAGELKNARGYALQALQKAQARADAGRIRKAERLLARVEAREELENPRNTGSFKQITGQITGVFRLRSPESTATPATPEQQATDLFQQGRQLHLNNDYYQAIEAYSRSLELNPRQLKTLVNRAVAYNTIREHDKALQDYNRALTLERQDADIWFNRGNTYLYKKDYAHALEDYNQALKLNAEDPDIYFNRGEASRKAGLNEQAIADFKRVIELSTGKDQAGIRQARNALAKLGVSV
jgi:RND superfamily putative drug exporter